MVDLGLPRVILAEIAAHGVHNDCVVAGREGACSMCVSIINAAMDRRYGTLPSTGHLLAAILRDFTKEA